MIRKCPVNNYRMYQEKLKKNQLMPEKLTEEGDSLNLAMKPNWIMNPKLMSQSLIKKISNWAMIRNSCYWYQICFIYRWCLGKKGMLKFVISCCSEKKRALFVNVDDIFTRSYTNIIGLIIGIEQGLFN